MIVFLMILMIGFIYEWKRALSIGSNSKNYEPKDVKQEIFFLKILDEVKIQNCLTSHDGFLANQIMLNGAIYTIFNM